MDTIRAQVWTIYAKLHARSQAGAVARFIQPGTAKLPLTILRNGSIFLVR